MELVTKKKILKHKRSQQDLEWIKKSILNKYGTLGLKLVESNFNYTHSPFCYLNELLKKLDISVNF